MNPQESAARLPLHERCALPLVRPYAKRGTKTAAREAAYKAGAKTFVFTCNKHGKTLFGTAGDGKCRACSAEQKRRAYERRKRQQLGALTTTEVF